MPGPTLFIMCGLPFSGKTTLARTLADQCGFVHLDLDALANTKGFSPQEGIDDEQWGLLFGEAYQHLAALLASGKSVVFDAVNSHRAGRDRLRTIAIQNSSSAYVDYINLSIQEIEKRRQTNQDNHQRPHVRDNDFVELSKGFEIPTTDKNLLIYDGSQSMAEWINHNIPGAICP
jgi:predicted kinase